MSKGVDYAWGKVPYDELKANGVEFVMRYISHDAGKDLSGAEKAELWKRGIEVGLVFESTAKRALDGWNAGVSDATYAAQRCKDLGLDDIPVYFACDWDATDADKPVIANYLKGAASVLGKDRVGVYGSYYVVRYMSDHDVCSWFWQTYAWSGGLVHDAAHILQWKNGQRIGGLSLDLDKGLKSQIGTRGPKPTPTPAPTPAPVPQPSPHPSGPQGDPDWPSADVLNAIVAAADDLRGRKGYWSWLSWQLGEGAWRAWGKANPTVRPTVPKATPKRWWGELALFLKNRRTA